MTMEKFHALPRSGSEPVLRFEILVRMIRELASDLNADRRRVDRSLFIMAAALGLKWDGELTGPVYELAELMAATAHGCGIVAAIRNDDRLTPAARCDRVEVTA